MNIMRHFDAGGWRSSVLHLYTFDGNDRLAAVASRRIGSSGTLPPNSAVTYAYDVNSRRVASIRENNSEWRYGYNDRGEVTEAGMFAPVDGSFRALAGRQFT
jgi:hypothetical protein